MSNRYASYDEYGFRHLPQHLARIERFDKLHEMLCNFEWMQAKLQVTSPQPIIDDYDLLLQSAGKVDLLEHDNVRLIQNAWRLSANALDKDKAQLASQLTGRLLSSKNHSIELLLDQIKSKKTTPWLQPVSPLIAANGPLARTLIGHKDIVYAVALSDDGQQAISASKDGTLIVWDLRSGREIYSLVGHKNEVMNVALIPTGELAISASADCTLKIWDLTARSEICTLEGHTSAVYGVRVTPDGRFAVSASRDHTLKIWNLQTGHEMRTLSGHTGPLLDVALSPDGKLAVSASADCMLKVWDLTTGKQLHNLIGHQKLVRGVMVSPSGKFAVSASWDQTLKVWDLETGYELRTLTGHTSWVNGVAVMPNERFAISGSADRTIKIWDLLNGHEVYSLTDPTDGVNGVTVTADGRFAVSASWDKTLKVWDLNRLTERKYPAHEKRVNEVAITPDGQLAISVSDDQNLKIWDLQTGGVLKTLPAHAPVTQDEVTGDWATGVTAMPYGHQAVSVSSSGTLKVWDLKTGDKILVITKLRKWFEKRSIWPLLDIFRFLHDVESKLKPISNVAVSDNGKMAITVSSDHRLVVWDLQNGYKIHTLKGHGKCLVAWDLQEVLDR